MRSASPLPLWRLLAYGLPGLPGAAVLLPLYIYIPAFYADDLDLGLASVGLVLLTARLWDVISDPLVGFLSDRIQSPWGRRRPWLLLGTPLVLAAAFPLFSPGETASALHLLLWTSLLYLGATMISLPHGAWGAELSPDYHERSRIAAAREGLVVLGTLAAAALPALLPGGVNQALEVIPWALLAVLPLSVAIATGLVGERRLPQARRRGPGTASGWKVVTGNRPFLLLIAAYLVNGIANGLPASLFLLFARHVLEVTQWQEGLLLLVYFLFGVASIPPWLSVSRRIGKHRAWMLAMTLACLAFLPVPLLGAGDFLWFLVICMATGACLGADLTLPASMQADVVDLDSLRSGKNRAGFFFAAWGMATKLALALAVGFAFPVLEVLEFDPQAELNGAPGLFALAALYAWAPILLKAGAIALFRFYPIDQTTQQRIGRILARRASAP